MSKILNFFEDPAPIYYFSGGLACCLFGFLRITSKKLILLSLLPSEDGWPRTSNNTSGRTRSSIWTRLRIKTRTTIRTRLFLSCLNLLFHSALHLFMELSPFLLYLLPSSALFFSYLLSLSLPQTVRGSDRRIELLKVNQEGGVGRGSV